MDTLIMMVVSCVGFLVAYHTYGRWLARRIFTLDPNADVPSRTLADGVDYVAGHKVVVFGHHFSSIAGTGPIVGPAIGVIWGWVPALIWVVFGSIAMGAVHDLGALVVSVRNEGRSISDIAAKYINKRVRMMFFIIVFFTVWQVIAIFGVVIAVVFALYPSSVGPVWLQIPIAMALGWAIYKKGWNLKVATVFAVLALYVTIVLGAWADTQWPGLLSFKGGISIGSLTIPGTGVWTIILLIYGFIASTIPVNILLQPRDYLNAWQLFLMMGLLFLGAIVSGLGGKMPLVADAVNLSPAGAPPVWPFLFVTIACGAISGFHSLVASGTSPKQLSKETDCQFVGYGSMLLEGVLAVLILVCVAAAVGMGDGGRERWLASYGTWMGESVGLRAKLSPVVEGAMNMLASIGIPQAAGIAIMGVFIASFAGTTLDTAVRIQRYIITEIATDAKIPIVPNRWVATTIAVVTAAILAFATGANGTGAMVLWPLFGTANQLLAALALLVVTMYLKKKGGLKYLVTAIPCVVMLVITGWAMVLNEIDPNTGFLTTKNWLLAGVGAAMLVLAVWMTIETVIVFRRTSSRVSPQAA